MLNYKLITLECENTGSLKERLIYLVNTFIEANRIQREDIIDLKININADDDSWISHYYGSLELIYWSEE